MRCQHGEGLGKPTIRGNCLCPLSWDLGACVSLESIELLQGFVSFLCADSTHAEGTLGVAGAGSGQNRPTMAASAEGELGPPEATDTPGVQEAAQLPATRPEDIEPRFPGAEDGETRVHIS